MHGRLNGADQLARGILALHARDGLKVHERVVHAALVIAIDTQPVHLAAAGDLVFADDRDVVLGLASHHAGAAADAGGQVDGHAPFVAFILMLVGIHR